MPAKTTVVKTPAQTAFQNAVKDVFTTTPANEEARAKLRDRLAEQVLPNYMAVALKEGNEQLDGAEFTTFLFDAIIPDKNKLTDVTTIKWADGNLDKSEKQTKLELPFKRKAGSTGTGTIKCSEMLEAYGEIEDLTAENQYATTDHGKVDAELSHRPITNNPDLDIVMSLRRHASRKNKNGDQEQYRIGEDVDLDIIELDTTSSDKKQRYEATSFIVHRGGINGGHYVTYVKEQKLEGGTTWVLYNDSKRTELDIVGLPNEAKQAYTIKFSPLDNESKNDASRYKTKLPTSQGFGTKNGGNRCWANAAFAFALSITSLHETDHTRAPEPIKPTIISSGTKEFGELTKERQTIESFVNSLIDFDDETASLSDLIEKLKYISENHRGLRAKIDTRLGEVEYPPSKVILRNSVERYLRNLAQEEDNNKTDEILGLREFFSDENNSENTLKIIAKIEAKKSDFIRNPQEFCAKIILPENTESGTIENEKKNFKPKAPQFVTTPYLCYKAIDEGDKDKLVKLLPHAIKHDKDFLTNALCHAILNEKDSAINTLINDYFAKTNNKFVLEKDEKSYTPLTAAEEKFAAAKQELHETLEKLEGGNKPATTGRKTYKKEILEEYSAKGILSKALRANAIEERAKTEVGKNENLVKVITFDTIQSNYDEAPDSSGNLKIQFGRRYVRKEFVGDAATKLEFNDPNFGDNSFANCTFTNCDFTGNSGKRLNFVNCTFGEGCVIPEDLKTLKMNFAGCKFDEKIFYNMKNADELKTKLGIPKGAVAEDGFYQSEKPSPSISYGAAFKLNQKMLSFIMTE